MTAWPLGGKGRGFCDGSVNALGEQQFPQRLIIFLVIHGRSLLRTAEAVFLVVGDRRS